MPAPTRRDIITEHGAVATELLKQDRQDQDQCYDVIVVGSGMGGGVVASALADENKKVLVLEAGSLLFPTHTGNLPRRLQLGKFQKHVWSYWDKFAVKNYNHVDGDEYRGGQAFNLGGRSIFWGSSIPSLAQWELDSWPKQIQEYLIAKDGQDGQGYKLAKETFNADVPELHEFHHKAKKTLSAVLGDEWDVEPAPVAVEYTGATEWSVPSGIFSTADLLLEDNMASDNPHPGRCPLTVNLNHLVWDICFDDKKAVAVNCWDLLDRKQRTYKAKAVVLAAGTLETAKIAMQSNIQNPLIGKGITDHPIFYRHFVIPQEVFDEISRPDGPEPQSTKLLLRHKSATKKNHAFDVVVELGAQFNQGRFVDHDHIIDDLKMRNQHMLCEIVFQFYAPLDDCNEVTLGGWNKPVNVKMRKSSVPSELFEEARQVAKQILNTLKAKCVYGEESGYGDLYDWQGMPNLKEAELGAVAHEVGTMRMSEYGKPGVVDEELKVVGYENLFVCDNSVFPCSPAGNPSLTLVALARRCAKSVAGNLHGQWVRSASADELWEKVRLGELSGDVVSHELMRRAGKVHNTVPVTLEKVDVESEQDIKPEVTGPVEVSEATVTNEVTSQERTIESVATQVTEVSSETSKTAGVVVVETTDASLAA